MQEKQVNELTSFRVNELLGSDGKQQEQQPTTTPPCPWLTSYEQALYGVKETEGKKKPSPQTPYKEKGKGKKHDPVLEPVSSMTARARTRGGRPRCTCSYDEAGEAALEIIDNCFGSVRNDFANWSWYCRHYDRQYIKDQAYKYASLQRQGQLRDAVTAFQAWLKATFPKPEEDACGAETRRKGRHEELRASAPPTSPCLSLRQPDTNSKTRALENSKTTKGGGAA